MRVALLVLLSSGCAPAVHQVAASGGMAGLQVDESSRFLVASAEQPTILGIVNDTDYVDQAWDSLVSRCPNGALVNVVATSQTELGFFSWRNQIRFEATCVDTPAVEEGAEEGADAAEGDAPASPDAAPEDGSSAPE